eukprot:CAMPEP_0114620618 /NCGR_PEP_ID=MMETSP0168-20121206/8818_1 /TAXON_ID=95228 ORGANISM="Vannella sp., Strain DIVA3 517/6/12" /NCGR_SAMPLE_ID=MMETSP0168 /ASSEMBLY_ACC=CAM_ASM_000044 /LENGTH=327 /DNA_ID=CAMNT_0001831815 /DNA_START=38 /DNA_END=1021 /DNA_ORIENTATION=+
MAGGSGKELREGLAWAAVERINGAWLSKDWESLEAAMDEEVTMALPGFSGKVEGRDGVVQSFKDFTGACETHEFLVPTRSVDVAGRTAVVNFAFSMVYVRGGRAYKCSGRDVWVLEERTGQVWKAVWRTMLDMDEWPLVTVSPAEETTVDAVAELAAKLSSELSAPVDLDSKFADAPEPSPSADDQGAKAPPIHFPGVAPCASKEERAAVAAQLHSERILLAKTAEDNVGAAAWDVVAAGGEAGPTLRVSLLAYPQDDAFVAYELLVALAEAAKASGCASVAVDLHEDLEEAHSAALSAGFMQQPSALVGKLSFVLATAAHQAETSQ